MEEKMEIDGDCFSVGHNIEVSTENGFPASPACSQISESDISVTSERGKGEPLDLPKVINDSFVDISKVPMRKLRKACPELYRRSYQHTKQSKRKIKYSWDPAHKPADWPSNMRFVDPNNGIKGQDGRFANKPGRHELQRMFVFLRDKYLNMSLKTEGAPEPVRVKAEEQMEIKMEKQEDVGNGGCGKRMQEESAPTPRTSVDLRKIMERRDAALDKLKHQMTSDPMVRGKIDRIKTELCAQYNRLLGSDQDMLVYMAFLRNCRQIEELTDNMDTLGQAYIEFHFHKLSEEILDGLRDCRRPGSGGFRQETVSHQAIQVHGVQSSDDVTAPPGGTMHNQVLILSRQHVHTTNRYTEVPPCGAEAEFDEKKCLPGVFEKSTPFKTEEKTVAFCFEPELNTQIDWGVLVKKECDWFNAVIEKVADDDDDMKFGVTQEELFNTLQVEVRNVDCEERGEDSKKGEEKLLLELPPTNLDWKSVDHYDIQLMDGVENGLAYDDGKDCVDSQPPTALVRSASMGLEVSLDASLNNSGFGDESAIVIHAPCATVVQDVCAAGYGQQEYGSGEIPSCVEAFNEHDEMMEDAVVNQTHPDLDQSFSDLSGFSFDIDKGGY